MFEDFLGAIKELNSLTNYMPAFMEVNLPSEEYFLFLMFFLCIYSGNPYFILGEVFLRKYFSVFDRDNNQIGFALSV